MSWQVVVLTVHLVVKVQLYLHVMAGCCFDSAASWADTVILTCHGR